MYEYKFIVDGEWKFSPADPIKGDEYQNINNIIDTSNYTKNNESDSPSTSRKSSFNNNNNGRGASPNVGKLGKVEEETQENMNEEIKSKVMPAKNSSSKNFDIVDFDIENAQNLFNNEAPMVPPHLTQIPFIDVKNSEFSRIFNVFKKEKAHKTNLYWKENPEKNDGICIFYNITEKKFLSSIFKQELWKLWVCSESLKIEELFHRFFMLLCNIIHRKKNYKYLKLIIEITLARLKIQRIITSTLLQRDLKINARL